MNVVAIHAKIAQPASIMSIDLNAPACQGTVECVAKMVRLPIVDLFIFFSVAPVKLSQEKEQVTYEAVLLLQIYLNLLFINSPFTSLNLS